MKSEEKQVQVRKMQYQEVIKQRNQMSYENGDMEDKTMKKKQKKPKKNKSENILCAIIALMKELDKSGLEFIKMDAKKRIHKIE